MGLFSAIFGGSKKTSQQTSQSEQYSQSESASESGNKAYDYLLDNYNPAVQSGNNSNNLFQAFLNGDTSGFNNFKKANDFDFFLDKGFRGLTNAGAASGLLRSGSTTRALSDYGNNMTNQYAGSYLDRLLQSINGGLAAGNLISGAGGYNRSNSLSSSYGNSSSQGTSSGSSTKGIAGAIGQITSAVGAG